MSNINDLAPESFRDIFGSPDGQEGIRTPQFGGENDTQDVDLFAKPQDSSTTDTTTQSSTTDTTTVAPSTTDTTTKNPEGDTDILGEPAKGGRKPKYDFSDATGYFADRIKSGKFVAITEDTEEGSKEFLPKTPEDFDEFIDTQVNYQLEQKEKEIATKWYQSKSPAWQAVAKFSEMTDDPTEIIPFLQGVKTIDSVSNVNEDEIDGAEQIVRARMEIRGDSKDIIDETIESLKTTDRLISTAKKYKPLIVQEEKQRLAQMVQEKKVEEQRYMQLVDDIRDKAVKAIETPLFGKQKLRQDEKAIVYDLIAEPDEGDAGYKIYSVIDQLFEKGDFETLKQIALLVAKKDAFLQYVSANAVNSTAEGLQRKLRVATEAKAGNSKDTDDTDEPRRVVQRNQYGAPRFGR